MLQYTDSTNINIKSILLYISEKNQDKYFLSWSVHGRLWQKEETVPVIFFVEASARHTKENGKH